MKLSKSIAILSLCPTVQFTTENDVITYWSDKSISVPTEEEINTELTRLTNAEPMRLLRIERNKLLAACDWRASSDLTLTDAWKTYRQSLRDLPASASPKLDSDGNLDMSSVNFPTKPS